MNENKQMTFYSSISNMIRFSEAACVLCTKTEPRNILFNVIS